MKDKFQMSSIGELTFFLGLQIKQKKDGIYISQDKYVAEILRKFRLSEGKLASTLIDAEKPLLKDSDGEDVDVHTYRQCKKQTVVATSSTEAEYVAIASGCTQVLWIQNQLLDYGYNFMHTIAISEDVIREILQLDDAEGVVCLPNEEIFAGLARMGYEKPLVCNVDSSSKFYMYPRFIQLIIQNHIDDLSTHTTRFISPALTQKVFENMRRVGEGFSGVETHLFEGMLVAREIAEEADAQVQADDAAVQEPVQRIPPQAPPQGAKFPTHLFQQVLDTCSALTRRVEILEHEKAAQKLDIIRLKARRVESSDDMEDVFNQGRMIDDLDKDEGIELVVDQVKDADTAKTKGRHAEKQAEIYNLDLDHPSKVLSMQEDDSEVQEVVEVVTTAKLITEVVTATTTQVVAASTTIPAAKPSIPAAAPIIVPAYTRRRKRVIIRDPREELSSKTPAETPKLKDKGKGILIEAPKLMKKKDQIELDAEYARKLQEEINKDHEEINKDIDWDAAFDHVQQKSKESQYIKRYQVMKRKPQTESEARKNMMIYMKNTAGYKMDFFKGMWYDEICPIFQARFDANMRFLLKSKEEMEKEDQEVLKSINETPTQKAAKRTKLNEEAQEDEDHKKRLEVVNDEDDDVFTEATPIGRKVLVVDYQIVLIKNKPRFKIIRADETHQLYISFITLLKNFDIEDLEDL
nr:retrotransposon protein, putative, unclassified [Tanacetum cinerariifolium]